jgi:hypothetical protein
MSAERKKILEMLLEGKITAEDAERLLDKIGRLAATPAPAREPSGATQGAPKKPRHLRILVERPGEDNVNVRLPLAFIRTGSRLLAVLPQRVTERLAEQGVDLGALTALKDEDLDKALQELNINIERGDGTRVGIFCE